MKKKKKKFKSQSTFEKLRRDKEINDNGKLLSLRPSIIHSSKKDYNRKWKIEDYL